MDNLKIALFSACAFIAGVSSLAAEEAPALAPAAGEVSGEAAPVTDEAAMKAAAEAFTASLTPHTGAIQIKEANATLNVGAEYQFLDQKDARRILEEAWGNPPDETVLGMVMPAGASPFDLDVWAATISYQADGYVSDKDAAKMNYDKLLSDLQKDAVESNKWRTENNYPSLEIIGWAENPSYDAQAHKMYWAKELKFGGAEANTLNYDIRVLGRSGVLVIGFIGAMDQLPEIKKSAPAVLEMANFDPGSTYAEYKPGVDKKAAYGIAGLIAGAAIAQKTGLLAAILLFGKKFIVIIIAGLAAMVGAVKRFFSTKA